MSTTLMVILLAALVGSASASPSPFCGAWKSNCVPDSTTSMYINSTLTTTAYTYPLGMYPAVDYEGTFGSLSHQQLIYNTSQCGSGDLQAVVYRFGDWVDQGPANKLLYREIAISPTSMKIRPYTDSAVAHLQFYCPCNNASAWQLNVLRTLTKCSDNTCTLPWINYTNVGSYQYGIARVDAVNKVMNVSSFTADSTRPFTDILYSYQQSESCTVFPPQPDPCGSYSTEYDCRASAEPDVDLNVKVTFEITGNAVGTFNLGYDYYQSDDTSCNSAFVGTFHTTGTYALHGPSNCSGTCNGANAIEVFATSATFRPDTQVFVDILNNNCPCNGTWTINQPRTISVCPYATCNTLSTFEFSHGIPIGTTKPAYGNILAIDTSFLAVTKFSDAPDTYSTSFDVGDHVLTGGLSDECSAGKLLDSLTCGQYISSCQGSADKVANFEENTTFFGPGVTGEFRRVYRQYAFNDRFCSSAPLAEYVLTGTYALAAPSTCQDCTQGTYTQFEVSITRSTFTLYSDEQLSAFKGSCPCSKATTWRLGEPVTITSCDPAFGCDVSTFAGIKGLNVGSTEPAYGTLTRFNDFVALTSLSTDMPTGFASPFDSSVPILKQNVQFTDCPVGNQSYPVCGVYHDACRGGSISVDSDNVVRTMTLFGDTFGEFSIIQSIYQAFDTACTPDNVNANVEVYGTFAIQGPSDCGGSCPGIGAKKIEMSVAHTSVTFYNQPYLTAFQALCPCLDDLELEQPRVFSDCPPGTCNVDIRGLTLGTSDPRFGSILRYGDMATISLLNPSSTAGYAIGFTSEDQAVHFDATSVAATCPAANNSSLCGAYQSSCSGYGGLNSTNTIESVSFDGNTTGVFYRTFKEYSAAQVSRCSSIVLQSWAITGTFAVTGPSTCGGYCSGSAVAVNVTSATITLLGQDDVDRFNAKCACGGVWTVGQARTITTDCDRCVLDQEAGAHGLEIGTGWTAFGSVTLNADRLALTVFNKNPITGYNTPFSPLTDRVFISDPVTAAETLFCAGMTPSPAPEPSQAGGLSAGEGLLIAFFCILGVYLIGGMAYNYRAGATGADLVPHLSFWKGVPGLVADGFRFAFVDCFGLRGSSAGSASSYTPVSSGRGGYGSV